MSTKSSQALIDHPCPESAIISREVYLNPIILAVSKGLTEGCGRKSVFPSLTALETFHVADANLAIRRKEILLNQTHPSFRDAQCPFKTNVFQLRHITVFSTTFPSLAWP